MREFLSTRKLEHYIAEDIDKLSDLSSQMPPEDVARIKVANDLRMRLLAKVLPDLKAVEHSGEIDHSLYPVGKVQVEVIRADTPHQGD